MPNYRRAGTQGATYFFTVNTLGRQRFLVDADVRSALREALTRVRDSLPFHMEAWVLLPDHLHCVWTLPPGDADFSLRWRLIKTFVTQRCRDRIEQAGRLTMRRQHKGQSTLWQNRYWEHQIRDERDFAAHLDYVHWNPVKHGYVSHVADWSYSSLHRIVKHGSYPLYWAGEPVSGFGVFGVYGCGGWYPPYVLIFTLALVPRWRSQSALLSGSWQACEPVSMRVSGHWCHY